METDGGAYANEMRERKEQGLKQWYVASSRHRQEELPTLVGAQEGRAIKLPHSVM